MFNPSQTQVRQFFMATWARHRQGAQLEPLEQMALDGILAHPEYHALLDDPDSLERDFSVEQGQMNPFLHLSMHLAIAEQLSIDQPPGIRQVHAGLLSTRDPHEAAHVLLESLGEVLWESQRLGKPLDSSVYLDLIHRKASAHR